MKLINFEKIFDKVTASPQVHEGVVYIENMNGDFSWSKGYGGKELDSPLVMASITKLFTTACIIRLWQQGKLSLEDKLEKYFDKSVLSGLHVYKGREYSFELTLSDLLFQVSGLPDCFWEGKDSSSSKLLADDFEFSFAEMLQWTKKLKPRFAPNTKGKAYYADINFDLLGEVIKTVNGTSLPEAYQQFIFSPLGLEHTYLPESGKDFVPVIYYKDKPLRRTKFICSCGASGGGITTTREMMTFLKSFWCGKLFDKAVFERLSHYNKLQITMNPICYAGGYMKIKAGLPFGTKSELLGHSGSTGSFAFYCPQKDLFFAGDINQFSKPSLPIRLTMWLMMCK